MSVGSEFVCEVDEYGNRFWMLGDKRHRVDGPAIEYVNGTRAWYVDGRRHREDGPAIEHSNGDKEWYFNGKLHRTNGPAIEYSNGYTGWWLNDHHFGNEEVINHFFTIKTTDQNINDFGLSSVVVDNFEFVL